MKKLIILSCIILLFSTIAKGDLSFDNTVIKENIKSAEGDYNFSFPFENTGDKALTIRKIKTSCGCTVVHDTKMSYAPGQKGEIKGNFRVSATSGILSTLIFVYTDSLDAPEFTLKVELSLAKEISFRPSLAYWKKDSESLEKQILIKADKAYGVLLMAAQSSSEKFSVNLTKLADESYSLKIKPISTATISRAIITVKGKRPDGSDATFNVYALIK